MSMALEQIPYSHWWLLDGMGGTRIAQAGQLASGKGVTVGIIDTWINHAHEDLDGRVIRQAGDPDGPPADQPASEHGTQVAGLIVGRGDNVTAGIGVAQSAKVAGHILDFSPNFTLEGLAETIRAQAAYDVSNNSWGFRDAFSDNFLDAEMKPLAEAIDYAVSVGRGGRGTVLVFAAGNSKVMFDGDNIGDDVNFHNLQNSRKTIAVGATDMFGHPTYFSTPGTAVLISAPGLWLLTSSGATPGSIGASMVAGTSFAAPLVSGAVALMLEANPRLGYRDVQEILALTARPSGARHAVVNGAELVNGGGLIFDREMGFGLLNAEAAVRLAKTWTLFSNAANEEMRSLNFKPSANLDPNRAVLKATLPETRAGFALDWVELRLTLEEKYLIDMRIMLVSPSGSVSVLAQHMRQVSGDRVDFTFTSAVHWGEEPAGEWKLIIAHPYGAIDFEVQRAQLKFFGDKDSADDIHFFTQNFARLWNKDATRRHVEDRDGGQDLLNFSAAGYAVTLDLGAGTGETQGREFTTSGYEGAIGSHRRDELTGGEGRNRFWGAAGDDTLSGGAGHDYLAGQEGDDTVMGGAGADRLRGGAGHDVLTGGEGADVFVLAASEAPDRITDFTPDEDHLFWRGRVERPTGLRYNAETGALFGDPDGAGPLEARLLAYLPKGLSGNPSDFFDL